MLPRQLQQRLGLGGGIHYGTAHLAGQQAPLHRQLVGEDGVQPQRLLQFAGETGKAAGGDRHCPARLLEGVDHQLQAGHPGHGGRHLIEDGDRSPLQQGDPVAQAVGKLQLALHGRRRHGRHLLTHPGQTGYLVDALDPDRGGIHVHHQQPGGRQGGQGGEMAGIYVPLLPLEGQHQLGGETAGAEQQQGHTGLLPHGIEAGLDPMVCQQRRHLCQVAGT
ncbi:hypothetical protein D3C76_1052960 [compost metagenome]